MKKSFIFLFYFILGFINNSNAQLANGKYIVQLAASGLALDAETSNFQRNDCKIQLWELNADVSQVWTFTKLSGNNYRITLAITGLALDAAGETYTKNGGKVHLWQSNNGFTQNWTVKPLGNDNYHISLAKNGKGLDADQDGIFKNGGIVQLWDKNEKNKDQIWRITTVPITIFGQGLTGRWSERGGTKPAQISAVNQNISVDMSAFKRPNALGFVVNPTTIKVTFPDVNQTLVGKLVQATPNTPAHIQWSNGTIWERWVD